MEKIKKYVERFQGKTKVDARYDMTFMEVLAVQDSLSDNCLAAICNTFNYGYAKGYRAARAKMRKGGAV